MNIAVVGTGYVGLVTGTCFAETGNHVVCVDIDQNKVGKMKAGEMPIYEPGLQPVFERSIREERLFFTTGLKEAVRDAAVIFLCLPTPPGAGGQADLSAVLSVAAQIGGIIEDYKVIVNKSTVPVGTADKVRMTIEAETSVGFDVVSNPEFLREGAAVEDFMKPERVVIGTSSEKAADIMQNLYAPFVRSGNPILVMDERSSEMTKYAANAMLAAKITFMNEIANICERTGANVDHVRRGIGTDSRIGPRFLFAGIGYGGSCFPKDVRAIHHTAAEAGYPFKILESVMEVNNSQKLILIQKIEKVFGPDLRGKTFGIWGLSFKPKTDDVREAPALYIAEELVKRGAKIKAYDPEATETFRAAVSAGVNDHIEYTDRPSKAKTGVNALVICTEWNEFRVSNLDHFHNYMENPVIFDGRNLYDPDKARESGITYISIGRAEVHAKKTAAAQA